METVIQVRDVVTQFKEKRVHDGLTFEIRAGEVFGLLGPSGCGKTTLMREMLMLEPLQGGSIEVLSHNLRTISYRNAQSLRRQWGVLFQQGALFSSLTVGQNIATALREYTHLSDKMIDEIVAFKTALVGLKPKDMHLYPSQISGGMRKKAALARALAMDPKLLFLDEPTSGLDPISAREFDHLILKLRDMLGLTVVMVSHDLQSICGTLDRMIVIDHQRIAAMGSMDAVRAASSPFIDTFFKAEHD